MDLESPLRLALPEKAYARIAKYEGFETVADLLWFLPRRYLDSRNDLVRLQENVHVVFVGVVESAQTRPMRNRRGHIMSVVVRGGDHEIDLTFFRPYGHEKKLTPGTKAIFAGTVSRYRNRWQLTHPDYTLLQSEGTTGALGASALGRDLIPVYREVKGIPSWTLNHCVEFVLDALGDQPDVVPPELAANRDLPTFLQAMRMVHLPEHHGDEGLGLLRLKYEEALTMQVILAMRRREQGEATAVPRRARPGGLLEAFDARLPFELTPGQRRVGEEVAADLDRSHPMQRLLQGEVGSGKTVVALRAMLSVIDAGGQAALLAPTEVLAAQHHRSITAMLGDLAEGGLLGGAEQGTRVALLTGSQSTARRREALLQAASGEAGIVVGTHALIQDKVSFADLGLVVVDEQHRFGVEQRDALRGKAKQPPHVLVMTATPIPRTVAMTVFGDMATSVLDELPRGRSPIASHVVDNPRWYARTWGRVAEEIAAGHQAYVVCPRIGDEDAPAEPAPDGEGGASRPARSVLDVHEELTTATPALEGARVAVLHGRLPADEKDAVMSAFAAGEIDVLVATTVIEVGVDVPNATTMVVLDADRFGVSQLHQLRGRIGRGEAPGLCLLVADDAPEGAAERVAAVAATTDGFALSRLDLEQRREGDVLGARQSGGLSQLRVLRLRTDERIISIARDDAAALVAADPRLEAHPRLAARVAAQLDEEQAAFLERG